MVYIHHLLRQSRQAVYLKCQEGHPTDITHPKVTLSNNLLMTRTPILLLMPLNLLPKYIPNPIRPPRLHIRIEDQINLLQRPAHRLGVHEEHLEGHDAAEYTEDDVCAPLDVVEGWCDEVGEGEVEDPVCGGGEADSLRAVF